METAAGGGCGSGPPLLLSEGEQQCYSELFARCAGAAGGGPGLGPPEAARAAPGAATAAAGPVADLFRASQLPAETLHQVGPRAPAPVGLWGPLVRGQGGGVGRQGCLQAPRGLSQVAERGFAAGNGGDALVPWGTPASSAAQLCWVRSPSSSPETDGHSFPSSAVSGALQPPRPKVCLVLEVVFVLAGVWFNLCSPLLPLPLLGGWALGCPAGIELEGCVCACRAGGPSLTVVCLMYCL